MPSKEEKQDLFGYDFASLSQEAGNYARWELGWLQLTCSLEIALFPLELLY